MSLFNVLDFGGRTLARISTLALLMTGLGIGIARGDALYTVRQSYAIKDLPAGAKQVKGWFWMPENRPEQQILDFKVVEGPASLKITRDPRYGRSWIYAEAVADTNSPLRIVTEFTILRKSVTGMAEASKATPMTEEHRRTYAAELRRDEKHMEVTPEIQKIADDVAGKETNPVVMAHQFFDHVILKSDHYSKTGTAPKGLGLGDATECLLGKGDTCTDQHALFIALCRARGIPCRLMYGSRLKPENAGKDHDPGYRCWPNFFAPGLGWVPLDVSSGDTAVDHPERWFGGLDENRLEWAEGRDFDFEPRSQVRPDLVIRGWVEVDGKPYSGLVRTVNFQRK